MKNLVKQKVTFYFNKLTDNGAKIVMEDKNFAVEKRTIKSNIFSFIGETPQIHDLSSSYLMRWIVKLSQNIYAEEDEGKNCKNYPYKKFANYSDCDAYHINKIFKENSTIMPFWAIKDLNEITNIRYFL